jgi:uncharacterized RDD family membrane protein YckC
MEVIVRRFFAFYIDFFATSFFTLMLYILFIFIKVSIPFLHYGYLYLYSFFLLYLFISELYFQTTIGKKIMKLDVVFLFENKLFVHLFIRTVSRLIPFDLISIFLNDEQEMWHDKLSKTKVILKKDNLK